MPNRIPHNLPSAHLISNTDIQIGDWMVRVVAKSRLISGFYVKSLADAALIVAEITQARAAEGLQTARAFARQVVGKGRKGCEYGEPIDIPIQAEVSK